MKVQRYLRAPKAEEGNGKRARTDDKKFELVRGPPGPRGLRGFPGKPGPIRDIPPTLFLNHLQTGTITLTGGALSVDQGGTGVTTANANTVFAGPETSGLATNGTTDTGFRSLVSADLPSTLDVSRINIIDVGEVIGTTNGDVEITCNSINTDTVSIDGTEVIDTDRDLNNIRYINCHQLYVKGGNVDTGGGTAGIHDGNMPTDMGANHDRFLPLLAFEQNPLSGTIPTRGFYLGTSAEGTSGDAVLSFASQGGGDPNPDLMFVMSREGVGAKDVYSTNGYRIGNSVVIDSSRNITASSVDVTSGISSSGDIVVRPGNTGTTGTVFQVEENAGSSYVLRTDMDNGRTLIRGVQGSNIVKTIEEFDRADLSIDSIQYDDAILNTNASGNYLKTLVHQISHHLSDPIVKRCYAHIGFNVRDPSTSYNHRGIILGTWTDDSLTDKVNLFGFSDDFGGGNSNQPHFEFGMARFRRADSTGNGGSTFLCTSGGTFTDLTLMGINDDNQLQRYWRTRINRTGTPMDGSLLWTTTEENNGAYRNDSRYTQVMELTTAGDLTVTGKIAESDIPIHAITQLVIPSFTSGTLDPELQYEYDTPLPGNNVNNVNWGNGNKLGQSTSCSMTTTNFRTTSALWTNQRRGTQSSLTITTDDNVMEFTTLTEGLYRVQLVLYRDMVSMSSTVSEYALIAHYTDVASLSGSASGVNHANLSGKTIDVQSNFSGKSEFLHTLDFNLKVEIPNANYNPILTFETRFKTGNTSIYSSTERDSTLFQPRKFSITFTYLGKSS